MTKKLVFVTTILLVFAFAALAADLDGKWGQGFIKADFVIDAVVKTHPAPAAPEKGKGKHKAAK